MKTFLLSAILLCAVSVNAQSLKELLYSGKLKMDSGTVIRKSDDLSTKIDTTTKKPVELEKAKITGVPVTAHDASTPGVTTPMDAAGTAATPVTAPTDNSGVKDNNKAWKDFIDELTGTLRTEVLPSKKIKDGTYSVLIEYEIGVDGQIAVNNVSSSPESSFLEQQIKERITLTAPQMTPLLGANGKPRKAIKKQTIMIAK